MTDNSSQVTIEDCLQAAAHLDLVSGHTDLGRRVRDVRVWDTARPADEYAEALVFVPGVAADENTSLRRVLAACAGGGAVGVVLRGEVDPDWAERVGGQTSLAILIWPGDLPWDEGYDACRDLIGGSPGVDELDVLLAAASACMDVSLLLEDRGSRRLAHVARRGLMDPAAQVSVLAGQAPPSLASWLLSSGTAGRLDATDVPVLVECPEFGTRLGIPVRGPHGVLGRLWALGERDQLERLDAAVFVDFAHRLAVAVHERRNVEARESRRLNYFLRGALAGGAVAGALADEWGVSVDEPIRLLAMTHCLPDFHVAADLSVLTAIVEARLFASSGRGVVVRVGNGVYLVARTADLSEETALLVAEESIRYYATYADRSVVAVVGTGSVTLSDLGAVRSELDRAMRLLAATGESCATTYDKLSVSAFFAELRELVSDRPRMLGSPLKEILALDAAGRSEYVATLQAYFSANCDLGRAARLLYVHRNTLKYRLARLQELTGLDLDDSAVRCAVEVQLRLLHDF